MRFTSQSMAKRAFLNFLNGMKSVKNSSFTHTSITNPAGSFYIPSDKEAEFFELYEAVMAAGCELHMTEKHKDLSPVLIDFDFRFDLDVEDRRYTLPMLEDAIRAYLRELAPFVAVQNAEVYVLEKPTPVREESKGRVKDGVHMLVTNVVTRPSIQMIARKRSLKALEGILAPLGCTNSVEDIFDEAVIYKNNWQMYGSRKPECDPYRVTRHWRFELNEACELVESVPLVENDEAYVSVLSIRNKLEESALGVVEDDPEDANAVEMRSIDAKLWEASIKREGKLRLHRKIIQPTESTFKASSDELELVKNLVGLLDSKRMDNYADWIRLGWCLRNIDDSLLDLWDETSQQSPKYEVGVCEQHWYHMKEGGLGIGTLHMWAKQDNPEGYAKVQSSNIHSYIRSSLSGTDYDIAMVINRMFRHRYRCASTKSHLWYEFRDHRWREMERGYRLFYYDIPKTVFDEYSKFKKSEQQRSIDSNDETLEKNIAANDILLSKIQIKFKNTNFVKDKMYKECSGLMLEPKFDEKLDSIPTLIGFENGIYDLESGEFREGRPEDYVSYSTGINYIEYDEDNPYVRQVNAFIAKVITNEEVREYVLTLFASMLDGTNRDENFHIWTGSGSNGKSKLIELFQQTIGDYACIFNVSMLTQKRVGSSATNSELAIAKGKRFAILQEPEENEKLNVGYMKELSGGDKVQCRGLFKEPIRFKPMFTMVLTCNHMPAVPPDDGGSWRRIRRVEFTSKFTDRPNPKNKNEFMIDRELSQKFELWRETFMAILLRYYKRYKVRGIVVPEIVMEYTNEYQRKNDVFADFCDNYVKKDAEGTVMVNQLFQLFREYCNADNIRKNVKKGDFQESLEKRFGVCFNGGRAGMGWNGIKIVQPAPQVAEAQARETEDC